MPKKLRVEAAAEQGERFRRERQKLIDAGELSLTDVEIDLNDILKNGSYGSKIIVPE